MYKSAVVKFYQARPRSCPVDLECLNSMKPSEFVPTTPAEIDFVLRNLPRLNDPLCDLEQQVVDMYTKNLKQRRR